MSQAAFYPVGTPGQPWGAAERELWRGRQQRLRRYDQEVLPRIEALASRFDKVAYGQLDYAGETYTLFALRSRDWNPALPAALVTGGVHGYETSGVMGALEFLEKHAADYAGKANLMVAPCVNPWGFERINRWNFDAIDPNRNFRADGPARESTALIELIAPIKGQFVLHIDLHETTDSDLHEFDPARCARDGKPFERDTIPDGFYVIGNSEDPQAEFQKALIAAVAPVTHIAPADAEGNLVGLPLQSPGVVWGESRSIGACAGFTDARFATTTEVYPDSPRTNPQECNDAQVAAVCAGLDFALAAQ